MSEESTYREEIKALLEDAVAIHQQDPLTISPEKARKFIYKCADINSKRFFSRFPSRDQVISEYSVYKPLFMLGTEAREVACVFLKKHGVSVLFEIDIKVFMFVRSDIHLLKKE